MSDQVEAGDVWDYPYLWSRQDRAGETEGRKRRPCAVSILVRRDDGRTWVIFLAITTKEPSKGSRALEVPEIERRRAGLDRDRQLWVVLDEHNADVTERSHYFDPGARHGAFSPQFRRALQADFLRAMRDRKSIKVARTDD